MSLGSVARSLLLAAGLSLAAGEAAFAAELVMFETEGCPWCVKWHRQVGPAYPKTDEGRRVPLRRVELKAPRAADLAGLAEIKYTPTFVVMECGREAGRVVGFVDEGAFWGELGAILDVLKRPGAAC